MDIFRNHSWMAPLSNFKLMEVTTQHNFGTFPSCRALCCRKRNKFTAIPAADLNTNLGARSRNTVPNALSQNLETSLQVGKLQITQIS